MSDEINERKRTGEPVALVMDLGGNWIRVALATPDGDLPWRERRPTNAQEGGDAVVARVEELLQLGIANAGGKEIVGMGLGIAGPVVPETGMIYRPPNIPGLDGVSFKSLWGNRVAWPVLVGNDATLAALGEYRYGAGAGAHTLVYITISTGIGAGIVVEGRPLMGAYGMAGELGHTTVDRNGPPCKCGSVGCLEGIASGSAIAETARRRVEARSDTLIRGIVSGELDRISAETVFEAAAGGDPLAVGIIEDVARGLGAGLVNVLHTLNPDVIVIGGGVSQNWEYLRPAVQSYIVAHAMPHVQKLGFKLVVSALGDEIGLLGAGALVWQHLGLNEPSPKA